MSSSIPPLGVTAASQTRWHLASELVSGCPPALGLEVALTGSVGRGVADGESDIELNLWVEALPTETDMVDWLRAAGATDIVVDAEPIETGSIWITFRFSDVWVEAGWQTIAALEQSVRAILAGAIVDHPRLVLAEIIEHAVPLRTIGFLAAWQHELAQYPETVQQRVIAAAIENWCFPHFVGARWTAVRRNHRHWLAHLLVRDVDNVLRLIFALNRRWEPDWKWLEHHTAGLPIKPDRLIERIGQIFATRQPEQSVAVCQQLILDALALVPPTHDVRRARAAIQAALNADPRGRAS